MYTQCPACSTYFRITPEQLQAAGGKVRCGECRNVFHAPDYLTDTLPGAPPPIDEPLHDEPDYEQLLREPEPEEIVAEEAVAAEPAPAAGLMAKEPAAETAVAEDNLAIDLDELFGSDMAADTAAEIAAAPLAEAAAPPPAEAATTPPPGSDTYGEDDIEALLTHVPGEGTTDSEPQNFALPWDEPPTEEEPAATAAPDVDAGPDTLADFDLPEAALTTARSVAPPPALSPLSALLAEEDTAPRRSLLAGVAWTLGSLLLLTVLAVQYIYLNRATLVHQIELRPLLEQLCEHTGCRLPPQRDLAAFTLLERDIRSHPQYQGALTISATLQNRAAFAQPYPAVEVVMRDLAGRVVAVRRFPPQEYLAGSAVPQLLAPQATAQLVLDVVDPGAEAVGFEFTFH